MECMRNHFIEGQVLNGRYRTVSPLNHGSFGMVFLGQDIRTGEDVAIKCLLKPSVSNAGPSPLAADDRSEELICHALLKHHPNLVNLISSFETEAHTYLVLEYCPQGDLYEAIRHGRGPLETEHVRDFMLQLVSAVEHMHARGLHHRDIKPENIFISGDGSLKLGDFGLATKALWSYESCVGSDRYMAPEQYDPAGIGYSPAKADIWSVGICLLNVLFSRNPFVKPTEDDILFADFKRDRQSLFDIFPNMSQDTFEILTHALAMDPEKRSLPAMREAIKKAVSFTTDDESLDEFCTEERDPVRASANREPLRTPSIQSPHLTQSDSFPWAQALQKSPPQPVRQLSAIPDDESYEEDLFPASEKGTESWFSVHANTPSLASFATSFKSLAARKADSRFPPPSDPVPITGSLPSRAANPMPSMSMVFGKKNDGVSKSWSDLWEEEESENEALRQRRENNGRSYSRDSDDDVTVRPDVLSPKTHSSTNVPTMAALAVSSSMPAKKPAGLSNENDVPGQRTVRGNKLSPSKAISADMWADLGNRRRNLSAAKEIPTPSKKRSMTMSWRKDWGLGSSGFDYGAWNRHGSGAGHRHQHRDRPAWLDHDWRRDQAAQSTIKSSGFDGSSDEDEWVGGWHAFHL
ncbi:putative serine threonine protein [Phaeomoniella chlamydospora]|uniref:Serine/threonine-protein kinase ATG1 n=1 Tax=Phaeomoniella chlamydospora TaxID=158046 RepID=A0A0G2ETK3_PHACM|nr:putative serine threonine protein [Phaeomoniella chlamydospora]